MFVASLSIALTISV